MIFDGLDDSLLFTHRRNWDRRLKYVCISHCRVAYASLFRKKLLLEKFTLYGMKDVP